MIVSHMVSSMTFCPCTKGYKESRVCEMTHDLIEGRTSTEGTVATIVPRYEQTPHAETRDHPVKKNTTYGLVTAMKQNRGQGPYGIVTKDI